MAHESFENPATAELMNRLFVNIKVDREERPDLDRIYQLAHQAFMGRGGGWPLTAFLMPDSHLPIFVGTYFPPQPRYGMPAFTDVLQRVERYAREQPQEVEANGRHILALLAQSSAGDDFGRTVDAAPIRAARSRLTRSFDAQHGGFGGAPKFPHPPSLELLLDWVDEMPDAESGRGPREMLTGTLAAMARGGLFDHLGGGFFRYCVDDSWTIPHFEKMLYDNAALLGLYADATAMLGDAEFADIAAETATWVIREMQSREGGYFTALDADSEGEEGKFYVWEPAEAAQRLDDDEYAALSARYGLAEPANFEGAHWHLQQRRDIASLAAELAISTAEVEQRLSRARAKLLAARARRVRPLRDEKVLTAWNGLMISGMARAARVLGQPQWAESAERAAQFLRANLWDGSRLSAAYKDGRARFGGYLDDHAFLCLGLLELVQCRFSSEQLQFATELLDALLDEFADPAGGFFFTARNHEQLIHRSKPWMDESLPSGNGIAALVLQAFGHLLGEQRYLDAARRTVEAAVPHLERGPEAHATVLRALAGELAPPEIIVIRGADDAVRPWRRSLREAHSPRRLAIVIPNEIESLPGLLAERRPLADVTAYCCAGMKCEMPITSHAEFARWLVARRAPGA
jgi:uncharacterized protein YyaL (SSP411 family)